MNLLKVQFIECVVLWLYLVYNLDTKTYNVHGGIEL